MTKLWVTTKQHPCTAIQRAEYVELITSAQIGPDTWWSWCVGG